MSDLAVLQNQNQNDRPIVDDNDDDDDENEPVEIMAKKSVVQDNSDDDDDDDSYRHKIDSDGARARRDRKDSSSSSSSSSSAEEPDLDEEISASTESRSNKNSVEEEGEEGVSKSQSRSTSLQDRRNEDTNQLHSLSKKSTTVSSDTEDDHDEKEDLPHDAPVPMTRKVSVPAHDDYNELTKEELELSKRETVHLMEDHKELEVRQNSRRSLTSSSSCSSDEEVEKEQVVEDEDDDEDEVAVTSNGQKKADEEEASHSERSPSPITPRGNNNTNVTKAYMAALSTNNNNVNDHDPVSKAERASKGVKDITQMYVENIAKSHTPPASPKTVARAKPAKDITQLYTGKIEQANSGNGFVVDKLSPKKHNMSTDVDKQAIREAYDDVRSDTSDTEWAVFKFDGNRLCVTATGNDFSQFKSLFGNDDRGFGYIRIKTGDEMSKRSKFVFVTWVGPTVSVMKKAKMSTDKALMKDIIQNLSVELQLENHGEFTHDHFKMQVDKAAGARYGTGVRDV